MQNYFRRVGQEAFLQRCFCVICVFAEFMCGVVTAAGSPSPPVYCQVAATLPICCDSMFQQLVLDAPECACAEKPVCMCLRGGEPCAVFLCHTTGTGVKTQL